MSTLTFGAPKRKAASQGEGVSHTAVPPGRTCNICVEEKTAFLGCPECRQDACADCYAMYFETSSSIIPPQCMFSVTGPDGTTAQCGCQFTEGALSTVFSKVFAKKVVRDRRIGRILQRDSFNRLDTDFFVMPLVRDHLLRFEHLGMHAQRVIDNACSYADFNESTMALERAKGGTYFAPFRTMLRTPLTVLVAPTGARPRKPYKQYDMCINAPACTGMFDMDVGRCLACETLHCIECFKAHSPSHVCAAEDIANAKYKRDNTKPCPRCKHPIEKGPACSQMMCTLCRCIYDWNTLRPPAAWEGLHNGFYLALPPEERERARELMRLDAAQAPDDAMLRDGDVYSLRLTRASGIVASMATAGAPWAVELRSALTYAARTWRTSRELASSFEDEAFELAERFDRIQSILGHHLPDTRFAMRTTAEEVVARVAAYTSSKKAFTAKEREANMLRRDTETSRRLASTKAFREFHACVSAVSDRLANPAVRDDQPAIEAIARLVLKPWFAYMEAHRDDVAEQFGPERATPMPQAVQWLSNQPIASHDNTLLQA